jgi:hypothetical protein
MDGFAMRIVPCLRLEEKYETLPNKSFVWKNHTYIYIYNWSPASIYITRCEKITIKLINYLKNLQVQSKN